MDVVVEMTQLRLNERQSHDLFTPYTLNLDFLLCRQITREMGEATNLRACGITSTIDADVVNIHIVMPAICAQQLKKTTPKT